jgi:hypothetical protein
MVWMTRLWPGLLNLTREVRFAPTSGIRSAEKRLKIVMENHVEFRARAMQAIDFIEVGNPFTRERS